MEISLFTKFTILKTHFFTKFTFSKSYFFFDLQLKDCENIYVDAEAEIKEARYLIYIPTKEIVKTKTKFSSRNEFDRKKISTKEIAKKVKEWKKKYDFHQNMATKREGLVVLKKEMVCAKMQECLDHYK